MFQKVDFTKYPPSAKPLMVYDGNCGFCKYWVVKWKKLSADAFDYKPFQEVSDQFPDIGKEHFQSAVRLILTDGQLISGPDAAYYTYFQANRYKHFHQWYSKKGAFMKFSDRTYQWVADNRSLMFSFSKALFGKDPSKPKLYWMLYLGILLLLFLSLVF